MLAFFRQKKQRKAVARGLYTTLLAQARQPLFYKSWGVPDTVDGRFESVVLHAFLVWHRLQAQGPQGQAVAQSVFDVMFRDMDRALRNIGVGDLSVPHHIKRMMKGFKGRALAYQAALTGGKEKDLADVLARNLFGTVPVPEAQNLARFSAYIVEQDHYLAGQDLLSGVVLFKEIGHEKEKGTGSSGARVAA